MHTYLRYEDGTYTVGMWLPNREGITSFCKMFDVSTITAAMVAVNMLNGGEMDRFLDITKEH